MGDNKTIFLIHKDTPGITTKNGEDALICDVEFDKVRVDSSFILGSTGSAREILSSTFYSGRMRLLSSVRTLSKLKSLYNSTLNHSKTQNKSRFKGSVHTWNKVSQIYLGCKQKHILVIHFW